MLVASLLHVLVMGVFVYGGLVAFLCALLSFALGNAEVGTVRVLVAGLCATLLANFAIESKLYFWITIAYIACCILSFFIFHRDN